MTDLERPILIYDGDCGFCRAWILRWQSSFRGRVTCAPYQEVAEQFPEIPPERFDRSIQLVEPDGRISEGAEAVFRALAYDESMRWLLWVYRRVFGFAPVAERVYRFVANRRKEFGSVVKLFWGESLDAPTHFLMRELFFRCLGLIYFFAFGSLAVQIRGLVGSNGILPIVDLLQRVGVFYPADKYWRFPTVFWFDSGDGFLQSVCWAGAFLALFPAFGISPAAILFLLWALYLSLLTVCREFMGFQWDILLLEAGFLAIFLAPYLLRPGRPVDPPSRMVIWVFRLLLFKLMYSSGVVKLASGDPEWSGLTALYYHYETQPLPALIGWYAHHLPHWFQRFSVACVFVVQLAVPFLIFAPRRPRILCCWINVWFQTLIFLTGNYGFFNLLTMTLCITLLDDAYLRRALPEWLVKRLGTVPFRMRESVPKKIAVGLMTALVLWMSLFHLSGLVVARAEASPAAQYLLYRLEPFRFVNGYGLFAVMTTGRPEIVIEGSNDLERWAEYEFKWKPGDLRRAPAYNSPHQPRLDWQMWFAALGRYRDNPWFVNLTVRLLEGSPEALALFGKNPFPNAPPKYIRALLYVYKFTDFSVKNAEGQWWRREKKGLYAPVMYLSDTPDIRENVVSDGGEGGKKLNVP